jgi:hypothetical protein
MVIDAGEHIPDRVGPVPAKGSGGALTAEDKRDIAALWLRGKSLREVTEEVGCGVNQVKNFVYGEGLAGATASPLPREGVTRQWLLDNVEIDERRKLKILREGLGREIRQAELIKWYFQLCRVEGSPEPHVGGRYRDCSKCPKAGVCSWGYVRCESIQAWEPEREVEETMRVIEEDRNLYEDCFPTGEVE